MGHTRMCSVREACEPPRQSSAGTAGYTGLRGEKSGLEALGSGPSVFGLQVKAAPGCRDTISYNGLNNSLGNPSLVQLCLSLAGGVWVRPCSV